MRRWAAKPPRTATRIETANGESQSGIASGSQQLYVDLPDSQERPMSQASNSSIDEYVTRFRADAKTDLENLIAKALISSNTPFAFVENYFFRKLIEKLGYPFELPNRRQIAGNILERLHEDSHSVIEFKIENADYVSIDIDNWQNIKSLSVLNIIICTPDPVFYKSFETGADHVTGLYIEQELNDVIRKLGEKRVAAVVTDCGSNMLFAQKSISAKMPFIIQVNCGAHIMNLLIHDTLRLPSIAEYIGGGKKIVKEICMSKIKLALFLLEKDKYKEDMRERGSRNSCTNLYIPSETRWYGVQLMLKKLLSAKTVLKRMAIDPLSELTDENRKRIKNDLFWTQLKFVRDFIDPMVSAISLLE